MCLAVFAYGKGFIEDRPWLAERSVWAESNETQNASASEPGKERPKFRRGGLSGWWAIGNGKVFGIVGPGLDQAMLFQITGPHIMLRGVMGDNAFGPSTLTLTVNGAPVAFTKQSLSKVRGTNIVLMELVSEKVSMTVINYAPFDVNAIFRTVVIKNLSKEPLTDVVLTATVGRTKVKYDCLYDSWQGAPTPGRPVGEIRHMYCQFLEGSELSATEPPADNPNAPTTGTMTVKIGTIEPDAEALRTEYLAFTMGEDAAPDEARKIVAGGLNNLEKTRDDWKKWMANTTQLKCADDRLIDLLDDTKILVRIQTADPQCAAGPMEFFAGTWVRDSNGPFMYYCRMGDLESARKMLEFYYRGCAYSKLIPNFLPMDIDITQPIDPNLDWTTVHNDPAEIPNWLIMQHRLYYQYTGDLEPIKAHWGYLKKCLMGQLQDDKGNPVHPVNWGSPGMPGANKMYRFLHHGDETWIYPGFEILNSPNFPEPNDHPNWEQFSADSTWEFVTSADTMAEFARLLGHTAEATQFAKIAKDSRAACERDYWMPERGIYAPAMDYRTLDVHQPPFAMVNFNPLWIGYLKGDDPKAISNVVETMKYTMNPNFVTDATETLKVYVGMQPGMFLYNLAAIDHPYAEPALNAMIEVALPTGEYTEKLATKADSYEPIPVFLGHRIRPWEGGINCDAAYFYLTGLTPYMGESRIELCPRMPADWKEMSVTGQKLGDGKLDIDVTDTGDKRQYTLKSTVSKPVTCDFKISLPQSKLTSVTVDGKSVQVTPRNNWGLTTAKLNLTLTPNKAAVVAVAYQKEKVKPLKFERQRWKYIPPKNIHPYQLVLWDFEPRRGNDPNDVRTFNVLDKDKVNYRMVRFNNPADAEWLRPMLIKDDGTLNTRLLLMGPGVLGPTIKFQTWWSDPALTKLLTDYMNAGGTIVAVNPTAPSSDFAGKLLGDSSFTTEPLPAPGDVEPTANGKAVWKAIAPLFPEDRKPQSARKFTCKNMVELATVKQGENTGSSIIGKNYGKGTLVLIMINLDYTQHAKLAQKLADPKTLAAIRKSVPPQKAAARQ